MPFARLIEIAEFGSCARAQFAFFVLVGAISLGCANARQAGGRALWFYPTIGAAIAGGLPWLTFSCPGRAWQDSTTSSKSWRALFSISTG